MKILLGFLILIVSTFSIQSKTLRNYHSGQDQRPKDLRDLAFRAKNIVYTNDDLLTVDKYINEFMNTAKLPTKETLIFQISSFEILVKNIQIPQKQLLALQNYAIALKSYNIKYLYMRLNQIIWWTELRLINDPQELKDFLNKQIYSSKQKEVIDFYAEKGMVNELNYWSKNLKKNRIEDEFKIAISKAEFIKLLKQKHPSLSKLVETELRKSIYYVMWPFNRGSRLEHKYIDWLFHQMGAHRKNPKISQILDKIIADETFLYKKKVNLLPVEMREEYIKGIHSNLDLTDKALQALKPYENIHSDRRYAY